MLQFLKAAGEALLAKGMKGLAKTVPFGEVVYDIAADIIGRYRKANKERKLAEDAEAMLKAEMRQVREDLERIFREAGPGLPPELVELATAYLMQLPGAMRQALKRADDPTGTTIPGTVNLREAAELSSLLPRRLPVFRAGESVPHAPQWRFVELLGAGGFGEVWLADHAHFDDRRAFKFCLDPASRERLLRHEGEVVKRVMAACKGVSDDDHGIVPLLDAYLEGETPWLAYEYVDGGDLTGWARANALRSPVERGKQALGLAYHLAEVVGRFHTLKTPVIHRDLKPANVLIKSVGGQRLLRVTDFGISHVAGDRGVSAAKVSTPSMSLGETFRGAHTANYASPQQKRGLQADPRDDVHALGIITLQLLLGDLQVERPSGESWKSKVAPCQVPDEVLRLLARCWDDEPSVRPANAAVFARQLEELTAPPKSELARRVATRPRGRRGWRVPVLAGVCLLVVAVGWFYGWPRYQLHLADGEYRTALALYEGKNGPRDFAGARPLLERAANRGHAEAQRCLGFMLCLGLGGPKDLAGGIAWTRKAVDQGDRGAIRNLGAYYDRGVGVPTDKTRAKELYERAMALGDTLAMNNLGAMYFRGDGVTQDLAKGIGLYRQAADAGCEEAMVNLGELYEEGKGGIPKDVATAYDYYRRAAEKGDPDAQHLMGMRSADGTDGKKDFAAARDWYLKAAEQENVGSMTALGNLYFEGGNGVSQDYAAARQWYERAAAKGAAGAEYNLALIYSQGLGVIKDNAEALKWARKSADHGDAQAKELVNQLAK